MSFLEISLLILFIISIYRSYEDSKKIDFLTNQCNKYMEFSVSIFSAMRNDPNIAPLLEEAGMEGSMDFQKKIEHGGKYWHDLKTFERKIEKGEHKKGG